ncbi:hypothetical protein [Bacillus atrophaeus]|uniref:hypothetical protein n=1 Tax=Bacillus atrophaeus TaxID=1452 RepID=UPI002E24ECC9|nr:hypothetical protein [Bacillus atrophaeus]
MIDFAITPSGDLIFDEFDEPKGFKLGFRIADNKGLNIKFHVLDHKVSVEKAPLKIDFSTKQKTGVSHKAALVNDNDQKLQRIRIALMTERGELPSRETVGSRLSLTRHDNLFDPANLSRIQQFVMESISGILSSPEVIAKPELGVGNFYSQTVGVYIYEEGLLIFKFHV